MSVATTAANPAIEAKALRAGYGKTDVLHDVNLEVRPGELVALLGPNGAGKTTLLRTLAGYRRPTGGDVLLFGTRCNRVPAYRRCRAGVSFLAEERHIFPGLTVRQSLRLVRGGDGVLKRAIQRAVDGGRPELAEGGSRTPDHASSERGATSAPVNRPTWDKALELFPQLAERMGHRAALLSGGEQQMLALALALARKPRLLIVDELSLGLAPTVRERLLDAVRATADDGVGALVVEQNAAAVAARADRAYVLRRGELVDERPAGKWLGASAELASLYLS